VHLVSLDTATGRLNRYATKPGAKPVPDGAAQFEGWEQVQNGRSWIEEDTVHLFRKTGNTA